MNDALLTAERLVMWMIPVVGSMKDCVNNSVKANKFALISLSTFPVPVFYKREYIVYFYHIFLNSSYNVYNIVNSSSCHSNLNSSSASLWYVANGIQI